MTITKYTYDNLAGTGFKWHPVTNEGDVLFYPCGDLKGVKAFVEAYGDLIADQQADEENNYGLAFYACGYNGKAPTSYQKAPIISTLGGSSHYYVENESSGRFSFIKAETFEQLTRHANFKNANLFIRPMHGREDWSNTISHEERENKTYFKINNKSDIEDFLD